MAVKRPVKKRMTARRKSVDGRTESGVWSRLMRSRDAKYFLPLRKGRRNPVRKTRSLARRSMTVRVGNKTLKILPQAGGMVKAIAKAGAKSVEAVFSTAEEALKWGLAKIGIVTNPGQMKVIRAIRNGTNPSQKQLFYATGRKLVAGDEVFMEMVKGTHPLKAAELRKLIKKRPSLWKRYEKFLPELGGSLK